MRVVVIGVSTRVVEVNVSGAGVRLGRFLEEN